MRNKRKRERGHVHAQRHANSWRKRWKKEKRDRKKCREIYRRARIIKTPPPPSHFSVFHARMCAYLLCKHQFIRYRARPRLFPAAAFIIFTRTRETGKKRIPRIFDTKEIRFTTFLLYQLQASGPRPGLLRSFNFNPRRITPGSTATQIRYYPVCSPLVANYHSFVQYNDRQACLEIYIYTRTFQFRYVYTFTALYKCTEILINSLHR